MSLRFKRGTTVRLHCTHSLGGANVNLTGYTVSSSASQGSGLIPLSVAVAQDQNTDRGEFTLEADTSAWAEGLYAVDVRFVTPATERYYTETFEIRIEEPIT
jgi:hypothetical protein